MSFGPDATHDCHADEAGLKHQCPIFAAQPIIRIMTAKDKKHKYAYVERDLGWMYFNRRILQEAAQLSGH